MRSGPFRTTELFSAPGEKKLHNDKKICYNNYIILKT